MYEEILWGNSVPPRLYSSSFIPILASNEYALGNGKKDDVLKFSLIKNIYQSASEYQNRETKKSIINRSNKFRLNENATYPHVALET